MPETKIGWIRALPIQWPTIFCKIWKTFFKKSNYCFICFIVLFLNHINPQSEIELELQALSYLLMSGYLDRGVLQKALFATVTQKHSGKVILLEPKVFSDVFQGQTWTTMATSNACLVCIVLRPLFSRGVRFSRDIFSVFVNKRWGEQCCTECYGLANNSVKRVFCNLVIQPPTPL